MKNVKILYSGFICACLVLISSSAFASGRTAVYEVTITNLTPGQTFTPIMLATHQKSISLFKLGSPASAELEILAESGNPAPLFDALNATGKVRDTKTNGALLGPGKSVTLRIKASSNARFFSLAAMLIPTNDAFMALNRIRLPLYSAKYYARTYDAGTEFNDESCANIPGPVCGGTASSPAAESDEGFVHVHNGMHGSTDLKASKFDWRNPTALIVVKRVK